MDNAKPVPLPLRHNKPRHVCSFCGMVSYSPGGIHPQCAQKQLDAPRVEGLKSAKKAENLIEKVADHGTANPWRQKLCPKCRTQLHVRKLTCDCGHRFSPAGGA
ncbi:MAG TPA: hypothetical protein VGX76_23800 [Pirellulales bacterium]|jgi:hypothetical protein|nr:hypothetical protein [Pirellulales bacterium]